MKDFFRKNIGIFAIATLTLGLAPFTPEPHLLGKLKWISGGAKGMQIMDWLDLFMHGAPWVLLLLSITFKLTEKK